MNESLRLRLACRIRDLLLQEVGEVIDVNLMLGLRDYAKAVYSLCRGARNAELRLLGEQFCQATQAEEKAQRAAHSAHEPSFFQGVLSSMSASPSAT